VRSAERYRGPAVEVAHVVRAEALLAAERSPLRAYIVVSLLTGARTEELRALTWDHIDLDGKPDAEPPMPPSIQAWRSVRATGDTKTPKSRRTLELPQRCIQALREHRTEQVEQQRRRPGSRWQGQGLVIASALGTPLDAADVRRSFRAVAKQAGLVSRDWTPRELRHSFVSLLSNSGVPIEDISRLVGHVSTAVTEKVYRKKLRPVLTRGATAMDSIFKQDA
jgi:integrase